LIALNEKQAEEENKHLIDTLKSRVRGLPKGGAAVLVLVGDEGVPRYVSAFSHTVDYDTLLMELTKHRLEDYAVLGFISLVRYGRDIFKVKTDPLECYCVDAKAEGVCRAGLEQCAKHICEDLCPGKGKMVDVMSEMLN
jgi:hypothetical protein